MIRTTTTYEAVTVTKVMYGTCPVCGKRSRRSRTFRNTVNPFNKRPDGGVRSYAEVLDNVDRLADQWVPDFIHEKCLGDIGGPTP